MITEVRDFVSAGRAAAQCRVSRGGTGSATGRVVDAGTYDGGVSWRSLTLTCGAVFGVPTLTMLYGPTWLLVAEAVPAGAVVLAAGTAYRVVGRRMRADHRSAGFGVDPDASRPDYPFAVTARPGRADDLLADGLAWSAQGCPMPAGSLPERRWCAFGHLAHIPAGGLLLPVMLLAGRRRWRCKYGHLGTELAPPVPFIDDRHGRPSLPSPVAGTVGGELAEDADDPTRTPAEVPAIGRASVEVAS